MSGANLTIRATAILIVMTTVFTSASCVNRSQAVGPADPKQIIDLGLGLERNSEGLADFVAEVSRPDGPRYGRYLTIHEAAQRFGASKGKIDKVTNYLKSQGLDAEPDVTHGFIYTQLTVGQAEKLLGTEFGVFKNSSGDSYSYPEGTVKLPDAIRFDVVELTGLTSAIQVSQSEQLSPASVGEIGQPGAKGCSNAVDTGAYTPNQLNRAYGINTLHLKGHKGKGGRAALIELETYDQPSMDGYTACFGYPRQLAQTHLIGDTIRQPVGEEVMLDAEVIVSLAPELDRLDIFQSDPLETPVFAYSQALDPANTGGKPVDVISTSVVFCEQELVSRDLKLMEYILATAAATGVTVVASSGDFGSAGCYPPDKNPAVQYPASSQYVTGVGGTSITLTPENEIESQVVWNTSTAQQQNAGGGGVSAEFKAPPYQIKDQIGSVNRSVPDVAFFSNPDPGYPVNICSDEQCGWYKLGGTSAAAPFLGVAVLLMNQEKIKRGEPKLGFMNPLLYKIARNPEQRNEIFRDVVKGTNAVFDDPCCSAKTGYDTASGWGSIRLDKLAENVLPGIASGAASSQ